MHTSPLETYCCAGVISRHLGHWAHEVLHDPFAATHLPVSPIFGSNGDWLG